jgi:hypothetical protein
LRDKFARSGVRDATDFCGAAMSLSLEDVCRCPIPVDALTNNWTVKVEYDYLGLGNRTVNIPATAPDLIAGDTFTSNNLNIQMVKVGVNYLFNWGAPVAARY